MVSSKPRKQRKQLYERNIFTSKKEMHSHLSKALMEKYHKRSFGIIVGDVVKIVRGKFSGKEGKIERVNLKKRRIYVEGIQKAKADGTFAKIGCHPSNVIILEFNLKDKLRKEKLEGNIKSAPKKEEAKK
jgi:large subunit ribosomal protein L24